MPWRAQKFRRLFMSLTVYSTRAMGRDIALATVQKYWSGRWTLFRAKSTIALSTEAVTMRHMQRTGPSMTGSTLGWACAPQKSVGNRFKARSTLAANRHTPLVIAMCGACAITLGSWLTQARWTCVGPITIWSSLPTATGTTTVREFSKRRMVPATPNAAFTVSKTLKVTNHRSKLCC